MAEAQDRKAMAAKTEQECHYRLFLVLISKQYVTGKLHGAGEGESQSYVWFLILFVGVFVTCCF